MQEDPDELKQHSDSPEAAENVASNLDKSILTAIEMLLKPIRDDIKDLLVTQRELKEELTLSKYLKIENRKLTNRIELVEKENRDLSNRVTNLEDKILESNLIFNGIKEEPWKTDLIRQEKIYLAISETIIGRTLEERLDTTKSMPIKGTKRIGEPRTLKTRPMSVEFIYKGDAEYILQNRKYLGSGVFVDCEYTPETERCCCILRPHWNAARKHPKFHRKCRMEGATLIVHGLSYTKDDINKLPEELNGFNVSSKQDEECKVFGFFGNMNPLSNFYPCSFTYKNVTYNSSEQMIQHLKSELFQDEVVSEKILKADTPLECKLLSRDIKNYN